MSKPNHPYNFLKVLCSVLAAILLITGISSLAAQESPLYSVSTQIRVESPGYIEWSPDETKLAVTTWPDIKIWDTKTWELIIEIHDAYAGYISWHPNGTHIASVRGGTEENLLVWNASTGSLEFDLRRPAPPDTVGIITLYQLDWSPNGEQIATESDFDTFLIWDWDTDQAPIAPVSPIVYHGLVDMEWHPDGERIATGGTDFTIRIWDSDTGENLTTVPGYKNVEFNASGTILFGTGIDNGVHIWDSVTGEEITSFGAGTVAMSFLELSPDDSTIALRRGLGDIEIWDVSTEKQVDIFQLPARTHLLVWSPSGTRVASATPKYITIWNLQ